MRQVPTCRRRLLLGSCPLVVVVIVVVVVFTSFLRSNICQSTDLKDVYAWARRLSLGRSPRANRMGPRRLVDGHMYVYISYVVCMYGPDSVCPVVGPPTELARRRCTGSFVKWTEGVSHVRSHDQLRYRLLMALSTTEHMEEAWSVLYEQLDWLQDCDTSYRRDIATMGSSFTEVGFVDEGRRDDTYYR